MLTQVPIGSRTSFVDFEKVLKHLQESKPVQLQPTTGFGSRITLVTEVDDNTKIEIWVNVEVPNKPANRELGFQESDVSLLKGVSFYNVPKGEFGMYGICMKYDEFLEKYLNYKIIPSFNLMMSMLERYAESFIPQITEYVRDAWAEREIGSTELYSTMRH